MPRRRSPSHERSGHLSAAQVDVANRRASTPPTRSGREGLEILSAAWSGEPVNHRGKSYLVDDVQFLPRPVQRPRVPVWTAALPGNVKPLRRAARYEGFFPVNLENVYQFARAVTAVRELRGDDSAPYDIAVELPPGSDVAPYAEAGATW
jgi:alkanesulfonate monooxygenase SsuD/methylene tetrahydromethanopterin reductase-like flavin-dependent oxidoreductase (luciferase family)